VRQDGRFCLDAFCLARMVPGTNRAPLTFSDAWMTPNEARLTVLPRSSILARRSTASFA